MQRWGATDEEVGEALPGDDLVSDVDFVTTRAVTIAAEPAAVWPWIVQMGQGRGGMYTYDWLENMSGLDMHSADAILPEWQGLKVGDMVPLEPSGSGYQVVALEPERLLLLHVDESSPGMMGREMARAERRRGRGRCGERRVAARGWSCAGGSATAGAGATRLRWRCA